MKEHFTACQVILLSLNLVMYTQQKERINDDAYVLG